MKEEKWEGILFLEEACVGIEFPLYRSGNHFVPGIT